MDGVEIRLCSNLPAVQLEALEKLQPLFQTREQLKEAWRLLSKLVLEGKLAEFACIRALQAAVPFDLVIAAVGEESIIQTLFQWIRTFSRLEYCVAVEVALLRLLKLNHRYVGQLLIVEIENQSLLGHIWESLYNILSGRESNGVDWPSVSYVVRLVLLADDAILPFGKYRPGILNCFNGDDAEFVFSEITVPMLNRMDSSRFAYNASDFHSLIPENQFSLDTLILCLNIACNRKDANYIPHKFMENFSLRGLDSMWLTDRRSVTALYQMSTYLLFVTFDRLSKVRKMFLANFISTLSTSGILGYYIWMPVLVELKCRNLGDEIESTFAIIRKNAAGFKSSEQNAVPYDGAGFVKEYELDGVCRQLVLGNLNLDVYCNVLLLSGRIVDTMDSLDCTEFIEKLLNQISLSAELLLDILSLFYYILNTGSCANVHKYLLLQCFPRIIQISDKNPFITSSVVTISNTMINCRLPATVAMGMKCFYECSLIDSRLWPLVFQVLSICAASDYSKIDDFDQRPDFLTAFSILVEACMVKGELVGDQILPIFATVLMRDYQQQVIIRNCLEGINVLIRQEFISPFAIWNSFLSKVHTKLYREPQNSPAVMSEIFDFYSLVGEWRSSEDLGNLFKSQILVEVLIPDLKSDSGFERKVRCLSAISHFPLQDIVAVETVPNMLEFIKHSDVSTPETDQMLSKALCRLCVAEITNMRRSIFKGNAKEDGGSLIQTSENSELGKQLQSSAQLFIQQLCDYWLNAYSGHPGLRPAFTKASFIFMPSIVCIFQKNMSREEIDRIFSLCLSAGIEDLNVTSADHHFLKLQDNIRPWTCFFSGLLPPVLTFRLSLYNREDLDTLGTDQVLKEIVEKVINDLIETRFQQSKIPKCQSNAIHACVGIVKACKSLQIPSAPQVIYAVFVKLFSYLQCTENEDLIIALLESLCHLMHEVVNVDENLLSAMLELCIFLHKKWKDKTTTFTVGCLSMLCMQTFALSGPLLSSKLSVHLREMWVNMANDLTVMMTMRHSTTARVDQEHGASSIFGFLYGISLIRSPFRDKGLEKVFEDVLNSSIDFLQGSDPVFGAETRLALFIGSVYVSSNNIQASDTLKKMLEATKSDDAFSDILICSSKLAAQNGIFSVWQHHADLILTSYNSASTIEKTNFLVAAKYLLGFTSDQSQILKTLGNDLQTVWRLLDLLFSELGVDRKSMQNLASRATNIRIGRVAFDSVADILSVYVKSEATFDLDSGDNTAVSAGWITQNEPKNLDRLSNATSILRWIFQELLGNFSLKQALLKSFSLIEIPMPAVNWQEIMRSCSKEEFRPYLMKFMLRQCLHSKSMSLTAFSENNVLGSVLQSDSMLLYWKALFASLTCDQISRVTFESKFNEVFDVASGSDKQRTDALRALVELLRGCGIHRNLKNIIFECVSSKDDVIHELKLTLAEILHLTSDGKYFASMLPKNYISAPPKLISFLQCSQILHVASIYKNYMQKLAFLALLYGTILPRKAGSAIAIQNLLDFWCIKLHGLVNIFHSQEQDEWTLDILDCLLTYLSSNEIDAKWFMIVFEECMAAITGLTATYRTSYVFFDSVSFLFKDNKQEIRSLAVKILTRLSSASRSAACPPQLRQSAFRLCSGVRGFKDKEYTRSIFGEIFKAYLRYYVGLYAENV